MCESFHIYLSIVVRLPSQLFPFALFPTAFAVQNEFILAVHQQTLPLVAEDN